MADRTGETVNLATLDTRSGTGGSEVLYLVSETGSNLLTLRSHVGLRLPVHATALGKCLLAQLGDEDARRAAGREPYPALTPRTVTGWEKLRNQLERVRREGVAHSREEYEVGLHSIAVPLAWVDGDGPVAVNVSMPSSRAGREATAELAASCRPRLTGSPARHEHRNNPLLARTRHTSREAPRGRRRGGGVRDRRRRGRALLRTPAGTAGIETVLLEAGTVAGAPAGETAAS